MWPNFPQPKAWEPPSSYSSHPVVQPIGAGLLGEPDLDLVDEILDCWDLVDSKWIDYDNEVGVDWTGAFYEKVSLNDAIFQTYSSEKDRKRSKCLITARSLDADGNENRTFGVIRKIILLNPFPTIKTVLNSVYVRVCWLKEIRKIGEHIVIAEIDLSTSACWRLHMCDPLNPLVVPREGSQIAIIDLERQYT